MPTITHINIDGSQIADWPSFYHVFADAFGFPTFFGRNMDAWIDCMTNLDEDFNRVQVKSGELVCITVEQANIFKEKIHNQYLALIECAAFVNWRRLEIGEPPILMLAFNV
ncbi:barstar family protein [Pectobacterium versatile]|uniref:barstar family protein n=1 Tax=Pectobacterium versatile TaxID=2488639 RepID=UPI001CC94C1E|nr:barstar family protein [Pectobacterium versatile]